MLFRFNAVYLNHLLRLNYGDETFYIAYFNDWKM